MNQHDTPAKVASTDGLGPLVADALTAADEYAEAAGHAECWTGTCASYNQHLADARTKVRQAIDAAVAAERDPRAVLQRALLMSVMLPCNQDKPAGAVRAAAVELFGLEAVNAAMQAWGPNA